MKALTFFLAATVMLAFALCGCQLNTSQMDASGMSTSTLPVSNARLGTDGTMNSSFLGVPPSSLMMDSEGTWMSTPGQGGSINWNPSTGLAMWSPKDVEMENVTFTPVPDPGQPSFSATLIRLNMSNVAAVYADQFKFAMDATETMSNDQRLIFLEWAVTTRSVTGDIARLVAAAYGIPIPSGSPLSGVEPTVPLVSPIPPAPVDGDGE